jgi:hypothetical protein
MSRACSPPRLTARCKLTILGHAEPRKQVFYHLTGSKNPNSVTSILLPDLKHTRVNIWAFDIPSFNTRMLARCVDSFSVSLIF